MSFLNDTVFVLIHEPLMDEGHEDIALLAGLHVLLVEDEPLIALDVEEICLSQDARAVSIVRDVEQAAALDVELFDVGIVDLVLFGRPTTEIAQRLRDAGVPFIFASGYAEAPQAMIDFPGTVLVAKPYAADQLIAALAQALSAHKLSANQE